MRRLVQWLKEWLKANSVMLVNASSLIGTTAVTSILGFVYWWIAAQRFPPAVVGIASASLSAMTLIGSFCVLGLGTLLITELPRQPDKAASLISTALLVVGGIGACVGVVFAIIASYVLPGFKPLGTNALTILIFGVGVSLLSITLVLDAAFIGLLRGGLQFWRNILLAVFKLVLLYIASLVVLGAGSIAIYATWAIGNALSLVAIAAIIIAKKGWPGKTYLPEWRLFHKLGFAALQHHLLNVILQSPVLILPVLVATLLSSTMNAWFYVAWMIASVVFLLPNVLTIVLHAMNSAQPSTLARKARVTMGLGLLACIMANSLLQFAAPQVLGVFGKVYAEQAAWTLRILLLASFPLIIKYHYISICRIHDRIAQAMWSMLPGGFIELGAAIVGAHMGGLLGLSMGWVVAIYIESLFMLRTVFKAVWSTDTSPLPLQQSHLTTEAIWQVDTMAFPAIRSGYPHTHTPEERLSNTLFHEAREGARVDTATTHSTKSHTPVHHTSRTCLKPLRLQRYEPEFDEGNAHVTDTSRTRLKPLRLQRYEPEFDEGNTHVTEKQIASLQVENFYVHSTMKEIRS